MIWKLFVTESVTNVTFCCFKNYGEIHGIEYVVRIFDA